MNYKADSDPNVLTLDKGTSRLGQGSSAHSCLVEIERYNCKDRDRSKAI
eukprot:UN05280